MVDQIKEINIPDLHERRMEQFEELTRLTVRVHQKIIEETGGAHGVRDEDSLKSAISAPFATFGGEDLFPEPLDKAGVLMRSLSLNHPFMDGNKRTSLVMTAALLFEYGIGFKEELSDEGMTAFCIEVGEGKHDAAKITEWLSVNTDTASAKDFWQVIEKLQKV